MKRFFENVVEWKTSAALLFSGSIILCTVILLILGEAAMPVVTIASLMIVSSVGAFLQLLAFSDRIIKKMRYSHRVIVFAVPFFALLAVNAYLLDLFPHEAGNWLIFTAVFLLVFLVMAIGFEIYFRSMGRKYDGLLGQYRRQRESARKD